MKRHTTLLLSTLAITHLAHADFNSDMSAASNALRDIMPRAETLIRDGKYDEAKTLILNTFPENTRTPAQALMLGSVFFKQDPKAASALHKQAAAALPDEPTAQLEWGMEQHRAGDYAGALESYAKFAKANPTSAPIFGLMAECYIRTGKTKEAIDAWLQSEKGRGSIQQFESWVCDVNFHVYPHQQRAQYHTKAKAGDIEAAEKLIALDADFPRDWWNDGPQEDYLMRDLAMLRGIKFADEKRLAEILCAGECALAAEIEKPVDDILKKYSFLIDAKETLPQNGKLLAVMLRAAFINNTVTRADALNKWGATILDKAKATKDAEMFNVAANLALGTSKLAEIDRLGWETTGDPRFAASLIVSLEANGGIPLDHPDLVKAAQQFPEDAIIAQVVLRATARAKKPLQPALIQAIKAEYTHFSPQPINLRPSAAALRVYFAELAKDPAPQDPTPPKPEPEFNVER